MVSVGVLVDLWWRPEAGGHVKCWERFAEAAITSDLDLDLTVYFLGDRTQTISLSKWVRYVTHPSVFSTQRFPFLSLSEHTDLAPYNSYLLSELKKHDVLHATHPSFTLSQTALRVAKSHRIPLIASLHTDVPKYTQIHTAQVIQQLFGTGRLSRVFLDRWHLDQQAKTSTERKLKHFWQCCDHIFVSQPDDYQQIAKLLPEKRISYLRRGIDRTLFHPKHRDRTLIQKRYHISSDRVLLLYVGRLDACKNVQTFAQTVRLLLDQNYPVHALIAGQGESEDAIATLLGQNATMLGVVSQVTLSQLYASSDLFIFPSETEIYSNAVIEAKASGLPVLVSKQGGTAQLVHQSGQDGWLIEGRDPKNWASAIATLLDHPETLDTMRQATYARSQKDSPSWKTVLAEDLFPIWDSLSFG